MDAHDRAGPPAPKPGDTGPQQDAAKSPMVRELEEQKTLSGLRAEIADNHAKLAKLEVGSVEAAKSAITVNDQTPAESLILGYLTLNQLARRIAAEIEQHHPSRVLMHNPADFKAIAAMRTLLVRLDLMKAAFDAVAKEAGEILAPTESLAVLGIAAVAGSIVSSVLSLVSVFKVDHTRTYGKLDMDKRSFAVAVSGALLARKINVYDTAVMPLLAPPADTPSQVSARLKALQDARSNLLVSRRQVDVALAAEKAKGAKADKPDALAETGNGEQPDPDLIDGLTRVGEKMTVCLGDFDALQSALAKVDDTSHMTQLEQVLEAEKIVLLIDDRTQFLWLDVVAGAGGSDAQKAIFKEKITFSAGVVVSYALYSSAGLLLDAATKPLYTGLLSGDQIKGADPSIADPMLKPGR